LYTYVFGIKKTLKTIFFPSILYVDKIDRTSPPPNLFYYYLLLSGAKIQISNHVYFDLNKKKQVNLRANRRRRRRHQLQQQNNLI
jgi:hypothetical protein